MKSLTHHSTFGLALLVGALACFTITGCGDSASDTSDKSGSGDTTAGTSTDGGNTSDTTAGTSADASTAGGNTGDISLNTSTDGPAEFEFADLVKPFDPPTLAEIISGNEWADKPVLDAVELMRKRQADEQPLATPAAALALKNSSAANNNKIISAMGRLAQEGEVNFAAEWNRHTAGDIKSTNPLMISSTAEFDVAGLTNMGLFGFDWNFVPFASSDAVISWQTSVGGLYDKVVMRDDLLWSDGTAITAHDVAYSYQVIMTSSVPIPAVRSGTDQLKYVHAYDDHTVIFFHNESLATNVWNINFPVIPKHIYESTVPEDPTMAQSKAHVALDENPVTGGAYQITKRVRGQEIVLKRRESYYFVGGKDVRRKPNFETIRFHIVENSSTALLALKKGDIEEMQLSPEQWQSQTGGEEFYKHNTKSYALEWVYYYFGWNNRSPFFRDARVRKAMSYAFNHQELLDRHRFGLDEAAQGIFHKTSRWAPTTLPTPYTQDLDKAEDLLAEAGWEDSDGDGYLDNIVELDNDFDGNIDESQRKRFEFTILTSNKQERIDICALLRENLEQIGIICNVKPVEFTTLQQLSREHKFDAIFAGWGTGADPDTSENLWTTKAIDAGRNYGCYSSKIVDQLFEDGKRELDPEKRAGIYQKIHLQLWDDQPYTWLYFRNAYYGFNRSLRGYNYSARGPYNYGPGESTIFKPAGMR
jgi:peptide/nickel transport system substrate-binding protein